MIEFVCDDSFFSRIPLDIGTIPDRVGSVVFLLPDVYGDSS